jgi:hypothetical protein
MTDRVAVAVEETPKKTFASAVDWPGWSRSGKSMPAALETLAAYGPRYEIVARAAGETFPTGGIEVEAVEVSEGGSGTAFGVPSRVSEADRRPTGAADAARLARLVEAAWTRLDDVVAAAPEELRKGPRGGGRNTSKIVDHTLGADHAYAREMGLKLPAPTPGDPASVRALRDAMLEVIRRPSDGSPLAGRRWTVRYAAHRIAWHSLDHAWEIEDRAGPGAPGS